MAKILTPKYLILIFILINLILGLFVVADYGRSPDEINEETRALVAINGFSSWENFQKYRAKNKAILASAISILIALIENAVSNFLDLPPGVIKHYLYFIFFQIGVLSFFHIAKVILDEWVALGATLLFGTQPLYVGHAFTHPKDIPFMAVFLATIALGLYMGDQLNSMLPKPRKSEVNKIKYSIWEDWRNLSKGKRNLLIYGNLIWPLIYFGYKLSPFVIEKLIFKMYYSPDDSALRLLFLQFASESDSVSISAYIAKTQILLNRGFVYLLIICLIAAIMLFVQFLPSLKSWLWRSLITPHKKVIKKYKHRYWLLLSTAGLVWGFCLSARIGGQIIGIACGGLVGLYLLLKLREEALFPLAIYTLTARISLYLFWPGIWFRGFSWFMKAMEFSYRFSWPGIVLYNGVILPINKLPRSYLPQLISIQFTEPVIIMGLLGVVLGGFLITKRKLDPIKFLIFFSWLFLPLVYSVIFQPTHYNNFRQYLFLTPPLFIFAGICFAEIVKLLKKNWLAVIFMVLILLPGVYSIFQLHPYQYIYYNRFVGGVEGAFRRFELDYFYLSYKEAMEYLNQFAPPNAKVIHWRDGEILEYYSRDDIELTNQKWVDSNDLKTFDYGIVPSTLNLDMKNISTAETVFQVERDGAVLVVVRKIK